MLTALGLPYQLDLNASKMQRNEQGQRCPHSNCPFRSASLHIFFDHVCNSSDVLGSLYHLASIQSMRA